MDSKIWTIILAASVTGLNEFVCLCFINFRAY